ncbi:MAG: single-stranded-DNA-specific exonuclease RecJ [Atopobiaceae bacterium]|jgi:single-stranded-DNA-specific exonuclease|nr:single-stranded-DNA-specific exonuclease RecJ [Atopobiaceae bacterium]
MSGLADSPRWEVLRSDPTAERGLSSALGIPRLVARVLVSRGIADEARAREFLSPSLARDWADPAVIPGLLDAAGRVERAIDSHERIAVFGDFDVDGMSSTCLLTLGLQELGADVHPFIPHRFDEGYGLSREALNRVIECCHPDLIVTVDNGIASASEAEWLLSQGIDVVVTDHHEPADLVPTGIPVADPKLLPACPSRELAGAGVALKLVQELGTHFGRPELWRRFTDVATLGTISDMMQLSQENRALVADGIARMRETTRPGLVALAAVSGVELATISSSALPFSLIPRLNAAGRMGETNVAFELLLTDDVARAAKLAGRLESINQERREIEGELASEAMAMAEATYDGGRSIVVGGEGWHEGVKGIVASRLVNRFHVPSLLFTISDGVAHGSGRSVGSVDLFHAVEQCSDLLIRFGGHAGAVGVTVDAANLDAFRDRLEEVLQTLPAAEFLDRGQIAAEVGLGELDISSIESLEMLQPYGQGNKVPLLAATGVTMKARARVGGSGDHLRFVATDGIHSVPAIMFRAPDIERASDYDGAVDLVFEAVAETWQGRTKPKLMVKDIIYRTADASAPAAGEAEPDLVEDLFARAPEILSRDEYAGIAEATSFFTKVVGISFDGRQAVAGKLVVGEALLVEHQKDNPADENAIALVRGTGEQVGFLRRQIAAALAPLVDGGAAYVCHVRGITGGQDRSIGVNVQVERLDVNGVAPDEAAERGRAERVRLSRLSRPELTSELRRALIGGHDLLPAQAAALDKLDSGVSTLVVMATGRGKSLVFHVHAAREAIAGGRASVFVYPLRALVADQDFHLTETFSKLGMQVRVLTGETPLDERDEVFSALASGGVDVVLTTPEFLAIHVRRFSEGGRVGFVVVDEAHHVAGAKGGNRAAYGSMPEVLAELGHPRVLAATATASDEVAAEICRLLGIERGEVVVDETVRSNLALVDAREVKDREAALVSCVSSGEKTVVYVNSREQSIVLARTLRRRIPELGSRIAFYNAGLTRVDRDRVEEAFRSGQLSCIVSTSAFGEGVNLPDIRNVMLYHMPFGSVEYNQMSGRAGRDGAPARVHLLFGSRDSRINERILESSAPGRADLVTLYRALRTISSRTRAQEGSDSFSLSNSDIASVCLDIDSRATLDERAVSCGISTFRELGFLTTSGYGSARRITMIESPEKMELNRSIRYLEGVRSRGDFERFRDWVLSSTADDLLARINRPIVPGFGQRV